MSEQATGFHPTIEANMVTSGIDVGRLKNTEFTRMAAQEEDIDRDSNPEGIENDHQERMDRIIKHGLASAAIKSAISTDVFNIASAGTLGRELTPDSTIDTGILLDHATRVGKDFDALRVQSLRADQKVRA